MTKQQIYEMHRAGVQVTTQNVADAMGLSFEETKCKLQTALVKMRKRFPVILEEEKAKCQKRR